MTGQRKTLAKIGIMACLTALTAFVGIAQADTGEWGGGHYGNHHHNFGKIAKKLGLTDAQKAQTKVIFRANKDVVKPILTSLHTERKNLHELMQTDPVDEAAIRAETAKIASIQADLNVNRAKVGAQFRAILTPQQLATLKSWQQKHQMKDNAATTPPTPSN